MVSQMLYNSWRNWRLKLAKFFGNNNYLGTHIQTTVTVVNFLCFLLMNCNEFGIKISKSECSSYRSATREDGLGVKLNRKQNTAILTLIEGHHVFCEICLIILHNKLSCLFLT